MVKSILFILFVAFAVASINRIEIERSDDGVQNLSGFRNASIQLQAIDQ